MSITGGCYCGELRYEFEGEPLEVTDPICNPTARAVTESSYDRCKFNT